MERKDSVYRLTVRFDLPIKDKRFKNDETSVSAQRHTSLSFGRQNGEKVEWEVSVGREGFQGNGIHGIHL